MSWLGERVTLPKHIEDEMNANRRTWKKCTGRCGSRLLVKLTEKALCMSCDPTLEQIQPGVFRTRVQTDTQP